jgi:hypothetical protein
MHCMASWKRCIVGFGQRRVGRSQSIDGCHEARDQATPDATLWQPAALP